MRVARYFPIVVLTGLVCEAAFPSTAHAWGSPAVESADPSSEPQNSGRIVDQSVQQANFYDSRPQANSTMIAPSGSGSDPQKRALFRGESLNFPKVLFGRQTPSNRPATNAAQSAPKQSVYNPSNPNNVGQVRPRVTNQPAVAGRPMQQRTANAAPTQPAAVSNQNNFRGAASRPPIPIHQDSVPRPMPLAARPMPKPTAAPAPNSTSISPWPTAPAAASVASPAATAAPAATAPPVRTAATLSPADKLVAQAHTWSTAAKTEQDYSRIIETCRRAQASQASPETSNYANNLTAWAFNRRGQLKAEAGHDKDAILDFDDAIRTEATCWRAVHNRGVLLAQAGQFEKAFDDFSHTIQLNPQFAKAYSNRAALFMVANNLNAAQQDYKHAIELDANLAVAHRGYGRVCQLLGRLDEAVGHYDAAVQLAPSDGYAAACRADLLTDVGRYSDALSEYNRALKIDPKSSQANCGSAWLLATCPDSALRDPELAVERANQAIEFCGQKDAVSFDSLAAAQASAGQFDEAMKSIRKAIELAPADERDAYKDRLVMYQQAKPYRIAPVERGVQQASYEAESKEQGAGGSKRL